MQPTSGSKAEPKGAPNFENTRLTVVWSKQTDRILRSFLGAAGMKKGDLSKFVEDAVLWRIFNLTVKDARRAFEDVPPAELQLELDRLVEESRPPVNEAVQKRMQQ